MKLCTECGLNYDDAHEACPACSGEDQTDEQPIATEQYAPKGTRPDGSVVIPSGWALIVGGSFVTLGSETFSPSFFFGAAATNLGFVILLFGYVVKAISFLPGTDKDD